MIISEQWSISFTSRTWWLSTPVSVNNKYQSCDRIQTPGNWIGFTEISPPASNKDRTMAQVSNYPSLAISKKKKIKNGGLMVTELLQMRSQTVFWERKYWRAKKLYDSPGMPRLSSISHHNPAWLNLRMKFRANWEAPQGHRPVQANRLHVVASRKEWLLLDTEGPSDALITWVPQACFNPQPKLCSRCLTPKRTLHKAHWEQAHQLFPSVHYTQPPCNPSVLLSRRSNLTFWCIIWADRWPEINCLRKHHDSTTTKCLTL